MTPVIPDSAQRVLTEQACAEFFFRFTNLMQIMTPAQLAAKLGISKKKVMEKIHNRLKIKHRLKVEGNNTLPEQIKVRRVSSDKYIIRVPDDYKFHRLRSNR